VLRWLPLGELALCALMAAVQLILFTAQAFGARSRSEDRAVTTTMMIVFGGAVTGPNILWGIDDTARMATEHWLTAYVILPMVQGCCLMMYVWLCWACTCQAWGDNPEEWLTKVFGHAGDWGHRILLAGGITSALNTAVFVVAMGVMRSSSVSVAAPGAASDVEHFVYSCTWPCVALRVVFAVALGSVALLGWRLVRGKISRGLAAAAEAGNEEIVVGTRVQGLYPNRMWYDATVAAVIDPVVGNELNPARYTLDWDDGDRSHRDQPVANVRILALRGLGVYHERRKCVYFGRIVGDACCLGMLALTVSKAWQGWPVDNLAEGLLTSPAGVIYPFIPAVCMLLWFGAWRLLILTAGARATMLSRFYDLDAAVLTVSAVGTGWLIYILRASADSDAVVEAPRSLQSLAIVGESIALCFWGPVCVVWVWNYHRGVALRRPHWLLGRVLLLWLPAAAWPSLITAWAEPETNHGSDFVVCASLALSTAGFSFEVAACAEHARRPAVVAVLRTRQRFVVACGVGLVGAVSFGGNLLWISSGSS
jgi:hypothetical protein